MIQIEQLSMSDIVHCGKSLRRLVDESATMVEVSAKMAAHVFDVYRTAEGSPAFALVRVYKTHAFAELPAHLQSFARALMPGEAIEDTTKCLTLLGTAGARPDWCSPDASKGHQSIPLPSTAVVERLPMVATLFGDLGLDVAHLLGGSNEMLVDAAKKTYNVFFVETAVGSPFIPAQEDFVVPERVRSVVGFGGVLPDGNFFAAILFTLTSISREQAELFRPLALSIKLAILPFVQRAFS